MNDFNIYFSSTIFNFNNLINFRLTNKIKELHLK